MRCALPPQGRTWRRRLAQRPERGAGFRGEEPRLLPTHRGRSGRPCRPHCKESLAQWWWIRPVMRVRCRARRLPLPSARSCACPHAAGLCGTARAAEHMPLPDTPLGLKPEPGSRVRRARARGATGRSGHQPDRICLTRRRRPRRPLLATAQQSLCPVYRRVFHGEPVVRTSVPHATRRRNGLTPTARPPDDWDCSLDACGGLFLSPLGLPQRALMTGRREVLHVAAAECVNERVGETAGYAWRGRGSKGTLDDRTSRASQVPGAALHIPRSSARPWPWIVGPMRPCLWR
jgi:hypothetical protein